MAFFVRDDVSKAAPSASAPAPDREAELTRAEEAMRTAEAQLATEAERLAQESIAVSARSRALEAEASGLEEQPDVAQLLLRLREPTPVPSVSAHVERALAARLQALEARRKSAESIRTALRACGEVLVERSRSLAGDAQTLARARSRAAEARAAQAGAATQAAPPPPPSEAGEGSDAALAVAARAPAAERPGSVGPGKGSAIGKVALKRVAARVAMQTQVDLASDSNFFTGFSTNISEGGLFVATVNVLPTGTPVDVSFTLPAGRRLTVKGEVRWTREINDRTPDVFPGVGVRFTELDPAVVSQIKAFVQQREPLFFPD
jgi:uncharacterized protein (TIGR02266 family)